MPLTSNDVVNQAIFLIGDDQPPVTGNAPTFDTSTAGKAAAQLYGLCVRSVGRQFGWDFSRNQVVLAATGNGAPYPMGYLHEYLYPMAGGDVAVQIWQLIPGVVADLNNPAPINWTVGNTLVAGAQKKVIWCDEAAPVAMINNSPTEATWDPLFQQAVVRLLASAMAMAIAGKPDIAQSMLESGSAFESLGENRQD
jgi:hypothetical protein